MNVKTKKKLNIEIKKFSLFISILKNKFKKKRVSFTKLINNVWLLNETNKRYF